MSKGLDASLRVASPHTFSSTLLSFLNKPPKSVRVLGFSNLIFLSIREASEAERLLANRREARSAPDPDPTARSKKWEMEAEGSPERRRRDDSRRMREAAARSPAPPSMERMRTFPASEIAEGEEFLTGETPKRNCDSKMEKMS